MTHFEQQRERMVTGASIQDARELASRCCDYPHEYPPIMREITHHKLNGLNDAIRVIALDQPGSGGANHVYALLLQSPSANRTRPIIRTQFVKDDAGMNIGAIDYHEDGCITVFSREGALIGVGAPGSTIISFQNGPIQEAGFNGLSGEALLAVQIDRMNGFQYGRKPDGSFDEAIRGKFASRDNALSLTCTEDALSRLQKRTRDRMARGVEGTHKQ